MIFIIISAILFGFVHPGSKFILDSGLDLLAFCILFSGLRFAVQLPVALTFGSLKGPKSSFGILVIFGMVGAGLQLTEFMGISKGLPVPLVTFLVYSHPIWTLLISRFLNKEPFQKSHFRKLFLATLGIGLLTGFNSLPSGQSATALIGPICASLMIALWICISGHLRKIGLTSQVMSLYYDFFSLVALIALSLSTDHGDAVSVAISHISEPKNLGIIFIYSLFTGLFPNYLFYYGSKTVPAFSAGLILLMEPVVSTLMSCLIWKDELTRTFLFGAACILCVHLPAIPWAKLFSVKNKLLKPTVGALVALLLTPTHTPAQTGANPLTLYLIDLAPSTSSDYIVSKEQMQIREGTKAAIHDYHRINSNCEFRFKESVNLDTDNELFHKIREISKAPGRGTVIGVTRSNSARLAARAASTSSLTGISLGASTTQLQEINPNFFSMASPWKSQWAALKAEISASHCNPTNTALLYDPGNVVSMDFKVAYEKETGGPALDITKSNPDLVRNIQNIACLLIPTNYSAAEKSIKTLLRSNWGGKILGIGDWNIFHNELSQILRHFPHSSTEIAVPTGWTPQMSPRAEEFSNRMNSILGEKPSPVCPYAYDATLIALDSLCRNRTPKQVVAKHQLPLVRNYDGIDISGNLRSEIRMIYRSGVKGNEGKVSAFKTR